ncbi:MAG: KH domain-containing protein [Candidatus Chisholmbacteria bacterium]|nr:KH domain-containing protein [Candidatus Chisholmbacteria bacterium]
MKPLLEHLLKSIADHPDAVTVSEQQDSTGTVVLNASVHPEDMGRVIGKQGRIINAIRTLVKVKALKAGQRVLINLNEPQKSPTESSQDSPPEPPQPPTPNPDHPPKS